jgi:hypothetical protein
MGEPTPQVVPGCRRCSYLEGEVAFYQEQMMLAANVAASIADLDEVAPALRQMLRAEKERRRAAEDEAARLDYRLAELTGTLP